MNLKTILALAISTTFLVACGGGGSGAADTTNTAATALEVSGTYTDSATGLTWMRCSMGTTWTGTNCTGTATYDYWSKAVALSGKTSYAGKNDWRLPNVRELLSIVKWDGTSPAIDSSIFVDMKSLVNFYDPNYWSSTASSTVVGGPWDVYFGFTQPSGNVLGVKADSALNNPSTDGSRVRMVRGATTALLTEARPTSDYVDNGDGTVTHTPSHLMWQRCAVGQTWTGSACSGSATQQTYAQAVAPASSFAGKSDWRLPTVTELLTLVDYTQVAPFLNAMIFPATPAVSGFFWSSTLSTSSSFQTVVNFSTGELSGYSASVAAPYTRLVRLAP